MKELQARRAEIKAKLGDVNEEIRKGEANMPTRDDATAERKIRPELMKDLVKKMVISLTKKVKIYNIADLDQFEIQTKTLKLSKKIHI